MQKQKKILFLHGFYARGQCVPAVALRELFVAIYSLYAFLKGHREFSETGVPFLHKVSCIRSSPADSLMTKRKNWHSFSRHEKDFLLLSAGSVAASRSVSHITEAVGDLTRSSQKR